MSSTLHRLGNYDDTLKKALQWFPFHRWAKWGFHLLGRHKASLPNWPLSWTPRIPGRKVREKKVTLIHNFAEDRSLSSKSLGHLSLSQGTSQINNLKLSRKVAKFICFKLLGVATKRSNSFPPNPQPLNIGINLMSSCCLRKMVEQIFFLTFPKNKSKLFSASTQW